MGKTKNNFKSITLSLTLLLFGCATRKPIPDVSIKPVLQYTYCQEQDGLLVAIDPFLDKEKITTYFGIDLLEQGFLPVLVVVENHLSKSGYLIEKQNFSILTKDQQNKESESTATFREPMKSYSSDDIRRVDAMGKITEFAPLFPILLIPAVAIGSPSANRIRDINIINDNLKKKTFVDKTIFPNENNSGFMFFQIKDQAEIKNIFSICLITTNILDDKELNFNFQIK